MHKRTWILILLGLIALFTLQNTSVVDVRFLFWTLAMSRVLLILVLLAVGMLLGALAHSAWQHYRRERQALRPRPPPPP